MPTTEQIEALLQLSDSYVLELASEGYEEDLRCGCADDSLSWCLIITSRLLATQLEDGIDDIVTLSLYAKLQLLVSTYSGASLPVDPNAQIPGITIVSGELVPPDPITKTQDDLLYDAVNDQWYLELRDAFGVPITNKEPWYVEVEYADGSKIQMLTSWATPVGEIVSRQAGYDDDSVQQTITLHIL